MPPRSLCWSAFGLGLSAAVLQGGVLFCLLRYLLIEEDFWQEAGGGYAFLWGLASPAPALVVSALIDDHLHPLLFILLVPLHEEAIKALVFALPFIVYPRALTRLQWLIAYALVVAVGFATTENVLFYSRAAMGAFSVCKTMTSGECFAYVWSARGLVAPFMHPLFTVWTALGVWAGARWYRMSKTDSDIWIPIRLGFTWAVIVHLAWNDLTATNEIYMYNLGLSASILFAFFPLCELLGLPDWAERWFEASLPKWQEKKQKLGRFFKGFSPH